MSEFLNNNHTNEHEAENGSENAEAKGFEIVDIYSNEKGEVDLTQEIRLTNDDTIRFIETKSEVPETKPIPNFSFAGSPAYVRHSVTALLSDKSGNLIGHISGGGKDGDDLSLVGFAFNMELVDLLPQELGEKIKTISSKTEPGNPNGWALSISEDYRQQGKAKELIFLYLEYLKNMNNKKLHVHGDISEKTNNGVSIYERTGADRDKNERKNFDYDIDKVTTEQAGFIDDLLGVSHNGE